MSTETQLHTHMNNHTGVNMQTQTLHVETYILHTQILKSSQMLLDVNSPISEMKKIIFSLKIPC